MTERQKLRAEIRAKKSQPKLTPEERRRKYAGDVEKGIRHMIVIYIQMNEFLNSYISAEHEKAKERYTVCLGCRKKGHSLKNCPAESSFHQTPGGGNLVCFNCNSKEHCLRDCDKPRDPDPKKLPFAKCFLCNQMGHLARDCDENPNGLYPNGGCCHICLQKTHLVRDCPERTEEEKAEYERKRKERKEKNKELKMGTLRDANEHNVDEEVDDDYLEDSVLSHDEENKWDKKLRKKKERKEKRQRRI